MKKLLLLTAFLALGINANSQTYTYHAFPDSLGIWSSLCFDDMYHFTGMGGSQYSLTNDTMTDGNNKYYESGKQIFMKTQSDSLYRILFDFNLTMGDTFVNPFFNNSDILSWDSIAFVQQDDSVNTSGYWSDRRSLSLSSGAFWVEGVGNVSSFFGWFNNLNSGTISGGCTLSCLFDDTTPYPCSNFSQAENTLDRIAIYPNPTDGKVFFANISNPTEIKVFNSLGVLVKDLEIETSSELDFTELSKGVYLMVFSYEAKQSTQRLIVN